MIQDNMKEMDEIKNMLTTMWFNNVSAISIYSMI